MAKVAFIIQFSKPDYSGLFLDSISRIKHFIDVNKDFDCTVYNVLPKPNAVIRFLKSIFRPKKAYCDDTIFLDCFVKNIFFPVSFIEYLNILFQRKFEFDYYKKSKSLVKYLKDFDLIAAHYGNGPGEIALALSDLTGIKFSVTYHGSDIHTTPFQSNKKSLLYKKMLRQSSLNIFVSKDLLRKSNEILETDEKRDIVLYSGIDFNVYKKANLNEKLILKKKFDLNKRVVAFVGNLVEVKNVFSLVEIFNIIQKANDDISFLIIGDGKLKTDLQERFVSQNVKVRFLGKIPQDKLPPIYGVMDLLILPSLNEGLPRVIIEALACDVNCIASKVGGIPEILEEEYVFELDKNFERRIAGKAIELLLSRTVQKLNQQKFNSKVTALKQADYYRSII